ncbi:MAG: hypothetical protein ACQEQF_10255 [Bacillota bacterium]
MPTEKILILENEFEAGIMEELLEENDIPYVMQSYVNGPYDGIWKSQKGWGHIEADPEYKEEILELYKNIQDNN